MRVKKVCLLAVAAALACLLLSATAQARRSVPQGFFGTVLDGGLLRAPQSVQDAQWARMATSGVESVRTVFSWAALQPNEGAPPEFSATDRVVAGASAHGIEVLPVVIYAPAWARPAGSPFNAPPSDPARYAAFLTSLIGRYGPNGSFWAEHPEVAKVPLRDWQVWNEPQLRFQWNAPNYAPGYGKLLRAAHAAIKQADPGARVVLAGATNLSWDVLEQLYRRGGIAGKFDVATIHPYTSTAQRVLRAVQLFRGVMRRHGDGRLPLWVTELGWPASKGHSKSTNSLQTTPAGAAARLTRAYSDLARTRGSVRYGASRVYWYTWASSYRGDIFNFTGLYRYSGGSFKALPQLATYRNSARLLEGCAKSTAGSCR
ncbi:MAG: beta-galactosidase [Thermoleophilaceae bacterium]